MWWDQSLSTAGEAAPVPISLLQLPFPISFFYFSSLPSFFSFLSFSTSRLLPFPPFLPFFFLSFFSPFPIPTRSADPAPGTSHPRSRVSPRPHHSPAARSRPRHRLLPRKGEARRPPRVPGHTLSPPSFTSEGDPSQAAAIGVQVGRMSVPRCRRDGRQHGAVALQFRTGAAASRFHCPQPLRNPASLRGESTDPWADHRVQLPAPRTAT